MRDDDDSIKEKRPQTGDSWRARMMTRAGSMSQGDVLKRCHCKQQPTDTAAGGSWADDWRQEAMTATRVCASAPVPGPKRPRERARASAPGRGSRQVPENVALSRRQGGKTPMSSSRSSPACRRTGADMHARHTIRWCSAACPGVGERVRRRFQQGHSLCRLQARPSVLCILVARMPISTPDVASG